MIPDRALHWFLIYWLLLATAVSAEPFDLQRVEASVFRIEASDPSGRSHLGSGVMVAPHTLVTNCHTIANAREIVVTGATGRVSARLIRANSERDLCLLNVPGMQGTLVTLGKSTDRQVGESVTAVGFPAGRSLTVSRGHIEGLYTYQGEGRVIQGSAYFNFGKSGGALFDQNGKLIGILTFKCRAGGPYHFSVPVEWVRNLMDDRSGTAGNFTKGPFWQHTDERQPLFLRAASLSATGDCVALQELASQWLSREPENAEAIFMAKRAKYCNLLEIIQRPLLEK